jgi:PAS domain S-box-containing protein
MKRLLVVDDLPELRAILHQHNWRVREYSRTITALSAVRKVLMREREPQAVFGAACRLLVETGGFRLAWVGLVDSHTGTMSLVAHAGGSADTMAIVERLLQEWRQGCLLTAAAAETGEPSACNDIAHDPRTAPWRDEALARNYRAMVSLPLTDSTGLVGTVNLYADEPGFFDQHEVELLNDLAGDIGFSLEVSRRVADRERAEQRLARQRAALIALANRQTLDVPDLTRELDAISAMAADTLGVERVSVWRFNAERTAITCESLFETSSRRHSSGEILTAATHPAYFRALTDAEIIAAADAATDPQTCELADGYLTPLGIGSMLDVPITVGGVRAGVVRHEHVGAPRHWTDDERTFAVAIANVVALTLERHQRRQAEEAQRQSLERFDMVARATNDAVWDWDVAANSVWWNDAFQKMFGFEKTDAGFDGWRDRIHPDDLSRILAGVETMVDGGAETWADEYRFQRRDGSYATVFDRAYVLRDERGHAVRMIGAMLDISDRKRAEEDLQHGEARYRQLFEANPHPMWVYGIDTLRFLAVNDAAITHYGYSREEFLAMTVADIRPAEDVPRLQASIKAGLDGISHAGLWTHRRKDGSLIVAEVTTHTLTFAEQRAKLVLAHDVTAREEAEARIRAQLDELMRWQSVVVAREERIQQLKAEVNRLLGELGRPPRYASQTTT